MQLTRYLSDHFRTYEYIASHRSHHLSATTWARLPIMDPAVRYSSSCTAGCCRYICECTARVAFLCHFSMAIFTALKSVEPVAGWNFYYNYSIKRYRFSFFLADGDADASAVIVAMVATLTCTGCLVHRFIHWIGRLMTTVTIIERRGYTDLLWVLIRCR